MIAFYRSISVLCLAIWFATELAAGAGVRERDAFSAYRDPRQPKLRAKAARHFAEAEKLFAEKRFDEALREFNRIDLDRYLEFGWAADAFAHYLQTLLAVADPDDPDSALEKGKSGVEYVFKPYRQYQRRLARLRETCDQEGFGFNRGYLAQTAIKAMRVEEGRLLEAGQTAEDVFVGLTKRVAVRPVVVQYGGSKCPTVDLVALADFTVRHGEYRSRGIDAMAALLLQDSDPKWPSLNIGAMRLLNRWAPVGISIDELIAALTRSREKGGAGARLGRVDFLLGELYRLKATRYYWMASQRKGDDKEAAWRYSLEVILTPEGIDCQEAGEFLMEKSIADAARWRLDQYRERE